MRRRVNCRRWSSCGRTCRTRSANSTCCAKRKQLQPKVRELRKQLKRDIPEASPAEDEQLSVADDYALGVLTALNRDGTLPFEYPAVRAGEDLDEVEASLERLGKKGER